MSAQDKEQAAGRLRDLICGSLCSIGCVIAGLPINAQGQEVAEVANEESGQDTSSSEAESTDDLMADLFEEEVVDDGLDGLGDLGLEDLLSIEVDSVAGVGQTLHTTPASIHVVTNEDIRRAGTINLPDALQLVPGYNNFRINSSMRAISSRGFAERFSNKLLVMIDGRTVFSPLFAGTYWESQTMLMEDLDRIEAIKGPGATLWGANAVNGVINIASKNAKDTQGFYATGVYGTSDQLAGLRYGGQIGENTYYRVWGQFQDVDKGNVSGGGDGYDGISRLSGGFRFDHTGDNGIEISVQGNVAQSDNIGESEPVILPPSTVLPFQGDGEFENYSFLFNIKKDDEANSSGWSLKGYYDRYGREGISDELPLGALTARLESLDVTTDVVDLDFRHYFQANESHSLIWGVGVRQVWDESEIGVVSTTPVSAPGFPFDFIGWEPYDDDYVTITGFIQDTITFVPDRLYAMVGTKFEHNDFTGFEIQPSARMWWSPSERTTLWGALSRPVRVPSRVEYGAAFYGQSVGDDSLESEEITSYEFGWREKFSDKISFDFSGFYNDYDQLISFGGTSFEGDGTAETFGGEAVLNWYVFDNWRLSANYSYTNINASDAADEGGTPEHTYAIRSYYDITDDIELNTHLSGYSDRDNGLVSDSSYVKLDVGLTWRLDKNWELAVWGKDLLDAGHVESIDSVFNPAPIEVPRSVFLQLSCRF